jgi:two-component system response regulator FixJ
MSRAKDRPQREGAPPASGDASQPIVHVIDDDESVRRSLVILLRSARMQAQGYPDAITFLRALPGLDPKRVCVMTDVRMPYMDGIELLQELRRCGSTLPVLVMTGHGDVRMAVRAMKAGAIDFIEKPYETATVLAAVGAALSSTANQDRVERTGSDRRLTLAAEAAKRMASLSPRERDVLELLVEGKQNKTIAHELGLSPRTVEMHRARMMERLGAKSLSEAVRLAIWAELESLEINSGSNSAV